MIYDYMEVYGTQIFGVLARDHKDAINDGFEVTLKEEDRHNFIPQRTRQELHKYLVNNYYEQKCLVHLQKEHSKLKQAQQEYEDNLKEAIQDPQLEAAYRSQKESFQKLL